MRQSRPPLVRMQYMHQQLQSNHYPNCATVAEYFEVSTKSIQRDVDYMRDLLHAPIEYDQKKRVSNAPASVKTGKMKMLGLNLGERHDDFFAILPFKFDHGLSVGTCVISVLLQYHY